MRKLIICCLLLAALHPAAQQRVADPFPQKVKVLKRFFEKNHYQPRIWDDTASAMLSTKWINGLDDQRSFFTQKDIAQFADYRYKLDDELKGNGCNFFNLSISVYQSRLKKTDSIIAQILSRPIDVSKPDNITWPYTSYAANDLEITQRWQRYLKWQILSSVADAQLSAKKALLPALPADFATLEAAAQQKLKKNYANNIHDILQTPEIFLEKMEDEYLNTIAWCYDPHSTYMNISEKKEWDAATSASEFSAGFSLAENDKGETSLSYLQPGGSAWRSGQLHTGDVLLKIKTAGKERNVDELEEDEVERLLSGNSEADLEVTVRTVAGEVKTVKLHKEMVSDDESIVKSYVLHGNKNIGYINLPGFYSREEEGQNEAKFDGCANDVSKEIVKLKKDNISGLILDLRFNGGGSMWEGMQLAGIFIDAGPIASMKDETGKVHFLKDPNRGTIYDGPLIVLINGASASASEFVSAALQDYNRALIVGGATYGKGTAQVVMPMDTGVISQNKAYFDYIKVTDAKFYRVNGSTTQWKGVIPDIELPDLYADDSYKEKSNASALQPDNSKVGMYQPLSALPIADLKTKSNQRIAADPYFKSVTDFVGWLHQYTAGRTIPLQWSNYVTHYKNTLAMFDALKDDMKKGAIASVGNNGFDKERIDQSGEQGKKINETYLKNIKNDHTIDEAYEIMMNWVK